ncbi:MAG: hypothetical protein K0B02_04345 [DPANN group archaeon]|nr:hypothetical protein [DPANN group archaeon]
MHLNAKISIDTPFNDIIYRSLIPDMVSTSKVQLSASNKDVLEFSFSAKDISSMRASFNTLFQLLKLSTEILEYKDYDK